MPRDASGNYTLPAGNPVVDGTVIESTWANPTMQDIAAQLNNVLTRDGVLGPTQPFLAVDGTVAAPGLSFASDPDTGLYRPAINTMGIAVGGVEAIVFSVPGIAVSLPTEFAQDVQILGALDVTGTLDVLGLTTFTGDVVANGAVTLNGVINLIGAATIALAAGTAALPSLYFFGDPNTGLYSPGPDQISFSTAGLQRYMIHPTGNHFFNAASASQTLDVASLDIANGVLFHGLTKAVRFGFSPSATLIEGVDNTGITSFQPLKIGGSTTALMVSGGDVLAINAVGNVSIAAPSAGVALSVIAAIGGAGVSALDISANTPARTFTTTVLDFATIVLHGSIPGVTTNGIGFASGGGGGAGIAFRREGGFGSALDFYTNPSSNAVPWGALLRMVIGADGGVVVATPSGAVSTLQLYGTGSAATLALNASAAGSTPWLGFNDTGALRSLLGIAGAASALVTGAATGDLIIRTQGNNVLWTVNSGGNINMMLASSGRLGLGGTLSPATPPRTMFNMRFDWPAPTPPISPSILLTNRDSTLPTNGLVGGLFFDAFRDVADPNIIAGVWATRTSLVGGLSSGGNLILGTIPGNSPDTLPTGRLFIDPDGLIQLWAQPTNGSSTEVATVNYTVGGYLKTWQGVTGSRVLNGAGYSGPAYPIQISIDVTCDSTNSFAVLTVGGVSADLVFRNGGQQIRGTLQAIVPPGTSYVVTTSGTVTYNSWAELR